MELSLEPPSKKRKTKQSSSSSSSSSSPLLSLPDVLILNCLSRISKSYYPLLSTVSKTLNSLVLSTDLNHARFHHKIQERFFHVCLQFNDLLLPSWFTLWIKPNQFDNNKKNKKIKKGSRLVKVPSSCASREPSYLVAFGSKVYGFRQHYPRSNEIWVRDEDSVIWTKAPNMTIARAYPVACVVHEKIYVMGGCEEDVISHWGEVFDIKTQSWEPLLDPEPEIRFKSIIKQVLVIQEKIIVIRSNDESNDSFYIPEERRWVVRPKIFVNENRCYIDDVLYCCLPRNCMWHDKEVNEWKQVRGLSSLNRSSRPSFIRAINYNGKLLMLWDKFAQRGRNCQFKNICCALIEVAKRQDGQVWGNVEWCNVVLEVPSSYALLRSSMVLW